MNAIDCCVCSPVINVVNNNVVPPYLKELSLLSLVLVRHEVGDTDEVSTKKWNLRM